MKVRQRRRHRIRSRTSRKLKLTLVALGAAGLLIGVGLVIYGLVSSNLRMEGIGLTYVLLSLGFLAARQAMVAAADVRHRQDSDHHADD